MQVLLMHADLFLHVNTANELLVDTSRGEQLNINVRHHDVILVCFN